MSNDESKVEGLDEAAEKVAAFIQKVTSSMEGEGELRVSLSQTTTRGGDTDIYETVHVFDEPLDEFVEEVMEAAKNDAEGIGRGRIKYSVKVAGFKGRVTFALKVPDRGLSDSDSDDFDDVDDQPNRRGIVTQQMRHNEVFARLVTAGSKDTVQLLKELLRDANGRIAQLERSHLEAIKAYEELLNMNQIRSLELMKLERSEKRKDQVGHVLMQGLPIIASKLLGGAASPSQLGGSTPMEGMLEGFLMTMTQDQLKKLMESDLFTPVQKAGLMEIIQYVIERNEAKKKAQAEANGRQEQNAQQGQSP